MITINFRRNKYRYLKIIISLSMLILIFFGIFYFSNNKASGEIVQSGDHLYSSELKIKIAEGQFETISGYEGFSWIDIKENMSKIVERLKAEYVLEWEGNWTNINPSKKPEGQVWIHKNSDLYINEPISVGGKGTIIVENGNLHINKNIEYSGGSHDSLGFIVLGSDIDGHKGRIIINIGDDAVNNLVGAYFSEYAIEFRYILYDI